MKKSVLFFSIFVAIISGITIGIIIHIYNDNMLEQGTLEEVKYANKLKEENIIVTNSDKIKTTPNTKIVFETFYTTCNHIEVENEDIKNEEVNQDEDYFKNKYSDWEVRNFSEENVELYKISKGICQKHYIVKEKDGFIAVFNLDSAGNQILKEVTEISTQYLPEEDKELLNKGIQVIGDSELAKVIEDYE